MLLFFVTALQYDPVASQRMTKDFDTNKKVNSLKGGAKVVGKVKYNIEMIPTAEWLVHRLNTRYYMLSYKFNDENC